MSIQDERMDELDIQSPDVDEDVVDADESEDHLADVTEADTKELDEAEKVKLRRINKALTRVETGEIALSDITEDWIKTAVQAKLNATKPLNEDKVKDLMEKMYHEKQEDVRFSEFQQKIKSSNLTKEQTDEIKAQYNRLRSTNVDKNTALEVAVRIAGVELDKPTQEPYATLTNIPFTPSPKTVSKSESDEDAIKRIMKDYRGY